MERFTKLDISLKNYLIGAGFNSALKAYGFAKQYHVGKRKDGITPEFQHQIEIALFATTLRGLIDEEKIITGVLLHDVMEDYDIPRSEISELFGDDIEDAVWNVTKVYKGIKKEPHKLFDDISKNSLSSIIKGLDRIHNQQSMNGVFTHAKQLAYIDETVTFILPMLKKAAYNFPEQHLAYMNIRVMIKSQISLIQAIIAASDKS